MLDRAAERPGKSLEAGLDNVVGVAALGHIQVQVHADLIRQGQKKVVDQFLSLIHI